MYTTKWIESGLAGLKKGESKELLKVNLMGLAEYWHKNMLPKRFGPQGVNIYHLQERTRQYTHMITKLYPNWRPLMASGKMASTMEAQFKAVPNVKENNIQIKITMPRGHPTQKYLSEELTQVNNNEVKELMVNFKKDFIEDVSKLPKKEGE